MRIGLALGGGFARGIAHVGVLRVFEENNIPISYVAGVSAGSMVAAAFAGGCTASDIEKVARSMRFHDVARWSLSWMGFAGSDPMVAFLKRFLKQDRFENMKTPLAIVATDLTSGDPVVFRGTGEVVLPIRASCAYPGLFRPIKYDGHYLVDGGVSMEVPVRPLREMGATRIIAVHLPAPATSPDPTNVFSVVNRCFQVMGGRLQNEWRKHADLVISPSVGNMAWDSFENAGRMIELGEKAALAALPAIQQWLKPRPVGVQSPSLALPAEGSI
jgi:NTE family protein